MRSVFGATERGQSEPLGVILILGITIAGTTLLLGFGASALDETRSSTELQQAELAMTVFDSKAATVALGDSEVQTVDFGGTTGRLDANPGEGRITIRHTNYDGAGNNEIIYQDSLGALVYENDGTSLAYQGGGVWRQHENGGVTMVSPPEFHYHGATLTLPLVRVTGSSHASAASNVRVKRDGDVERVFPNASETYDGNTHYLNPSEYGQIEVIVESEYYQGWADYFRERTNANVNVDENDEKVIVELISTGNTGQFEMPGEDSSVNVRGVGGHGMSDFTVTIRPDDTDSANFNNLKWSMYIDEGTTEFELHVRKGTDESGCDTTASVTVYYSTDNGETYHGWHKQDAYEAECGDYDGDGDDEIRMVLDFVDDESGDGDVHDDESDDPRLEYTDLSSSETMEFNPSGADHKDSVTFSGHGVYWESKEYVAGNGDKESIDRLLNHYFSEIGRFDLTVTDTNANSVNEGQSYGSIDYGGGGRYVTYLHVTENNVDIEAR